MRGSVELRYECREQFEDYGGRGHQDYRRGRCRKQREQRVLGIARVPSTPRPCVGLNVGRRV